KYGLISEKVVLRRRNQIYIETEFRQLFTEIIMPACIPVDGSRCILINNPNGLIHNRKANFSNNSEIDRFFYCAKKRTSIWSQKLPNGYKTGNNKIKLP